MAKIPGGEAFGQVVARPGPVAGADPNAYGANIGRALQQTGQIGMNVAGDQIAKRQQELDQAERERVAEAKRVAAEAKRVQMLVTVETVRNGIADLDLEVGSQLDTGALDKTKAKDYGTTRANKIVEDALKGVDPEYQGLVRASVMGQVGQFGRNLQGNIVKRDQKDILAGAVGYFEQMERQAARGPKQADEAIKSVREFWTATHASAGEDAAQASRRIQVFAEGVRARQAGDLVNADPGAALRALRNPDYMPELDPDRRAALVQTADAALLRNQQRAALNAEAAARRQEKEWNAAQTVFQAGKVPTPEYADRLAKQFKGTPYEAALKSMMADGPANASFAAQPVRLQEQALIAAQNAMNQGGATPEQIKEYERLKKVHEATQRDIKEDPYSAASERGLVTNLTPLSLDLNTLPQQLAKRSQEAGVVSQWAGSEVSLFRPGEASKVGELLQAMPPKDRAGALSGIAKTMTAPQMRAFAAQLGAKDQALSAAAMLAATNARTSEGRTVAEIVLAGADARKEQRLKYPSGTSETSIRAKIDQELRGVFLSENAQRAATDAAVAVYSGLLAEGGDPSIRQAVSLATGGVMEMNGAKFVKPYGWEDSRVEKALRNLDQPKIEKLTGGKPVMIGGAAVPGDQLARVAKDAQLGPSPKAGSYTVSIGGRLLTDDKGAPILLPLAEVE